MYGGQTSQFAPGARHRQVSTGITDDRRLEGIRRGVVATSTGDSRESQASTDVDEADQEHTNAQANQEEPPRSKTPAARSKTPNPGSHRTKTMVPNRPKSSMGQQPEMTEYEMLPYQEPSTMPVRRSGTPSLIPRPKTPSTSSLLSPSLIPRPRSSLRSPLPSYGGGGRKQLRIFASSIE